MPSKAEQVAARIASALTGTTNAGARVYRDRDDAFTREESPAILVEVVDEDSTPMGGAAGMGMLGQTDMDTLRVAVTVCVRGAAWQQAADAVRVQANALLSADLTLRGLVADFRRDRCEWRSQSADLPFGYAAQIYAFKYHTRASALDASL